jgi:cysteine desulfurase/selenocysteine lyase
MTIDASAVRREFPALERWTYLNTATYGLVPARAVAANAAHWAHRDELACSDFIGWYDDADRVRASVARLIHASPDDIAFVPNAAAALGLLVAGLDWRRGDNVVTLAGEFPNCLYLPALLDRRGVATREVLPGRAEDIDAAVDSRTRLVALSEVNYATGFRPPLADLSRRLHDRGVLLFLDGTQSVGGVQFDVRATAPDMLAVHGYKWLISPTGAGFMYVAPSLRARLDPIVVGWRSHHEWRNVDNLHHGTPVFGGDADRYEGGGLPFGLLHAMGCAVDWMLDLGLDAIERRVMTLAESARGRLERLGAEPSVIAGLPSPIVSVRFPGRDPSALTRALHERRVLVAARHGCLRVSPHFYNDESDLDQLEGELRTVILRV